MGLHALQLNYGHARPRLTQCSGQVTRSQVDNAPAGGGLTGRQGALSNLTRVSGFFGSRACRTSPVPEPAVRPRSSVTLRIAPMAMRNMLTAAPATRVSSFSRCPSLSHSPSGPAQTSGPADMGRRGTAAAGQGLSCEDGRPGMCTSIIRRHWGNGSNGKTATATTTATLVAGCGNDPGEKEAGAAGGESGARAHGPALGGEAGSVLIVSLSAKCPRMRPPVPVSLLLVAYPPQVPVAASAQSNYNICGRV